MTPPSIPKPKIEGFVIYNPTTGKWSKGGTYEHRIWGDRPKIWKTMGHLKNHLGQLLQGGWHYEEVDGERKKFRILSPVYQGCVVFNIATDEPVEFDFYQYVIDKVRSHHYYKDTKFVIKDD